MKETTEVQKVEKKAPAFNIETLISQAVAKDISVESLSRLLDMRKQLRDEWAKEQFYISLAAFQGECPIIEKKKKVAFNTTNYSYAPLEDIIEQVRGILEKYGFSYMFDTETNGKMKVICKVKHQAGHSEIVTFAMEIDANAKMNVSQKYGSALTYAKRYAFCAAFGITVKDEDTEMKIKEVETVGIDTSDIAAIDTSTNQKDLLRLCSDLKKKYPEKLKTLLNLYTIRKTEIETMGVDEMNNQAEEALK